MSNVNLDPLAPADDVTLRDERSFGEILSSFEQQHPDGRGAETVTGTIVSVGPEAILIDVGRKIEGSLRVSKWRETQKGEPEKGDSIVVSLGPRNEEGYYELSTVKVARPKDWSGLQAAFAEKRTIGGTVIEQVKGGFRVDVGVVAFMPASRSGVRGAPGPSGPDPKGAAEEMPALVGQDIQCRITKLDVEKEDVVVDRRVVLEQEEALRKQQAFEQLREGAVVRGRVRTVMDFGAFVDLGGIDGLLHVAEMSFSRVAKAGDAVKAGDELEVKVLKIDAASRKISLGLKQLQEDPWTVAARSFHVGDRVSGTVSRLTDFGAFVELLPGVDGLIHLSELSWNKRVRKPGDLLKTGERVEAVVLQVNAAERRIGLGYKQALGDPWDTVAQKFPAGAVVEGPITNVMQFGAFVELGDGIEGMVHISDITNEKRLDHPREKLVKGQIVRAVVLEIDRERRRLRLGMKQLEPTTLDHYIGEHHSGQTVSGRLLEVRGENAKVELDEGVIATCRLKALNKSAETVPAASPAKPENLAVGKDLPSLTAMLAAKWKQGGIEEQAKKPVAGQVRSFRISNLDPSKRLIELELAN